MILESIKYMIIRKNIKVLVVDDSILSRELIARGIAKDPLIEVIGTAADPFEARDRIQEISPDVMILDVNMPKMNGIDFLKRIMDQFPIPVIVISSSPAYVMDALKAGALDFVAKPEVKDVRDIEDFISEMIVKIKTASQANIKCLPSIKDIASSNSEKSIKPINVIAIGASTGGTEAIYSIIKSLPLNVPGIVIVQHMPPVFTKKYAERLDSTTPFSAKEAETGDLVQPGKVLVAPGNMHMKLKKMGESYSVECVIGEKVNGHCPSVDVLFESVAKVAGRQALGVILTGMGGDGAKGLLAMRKSGAKTIGQDEASSVVYGMPKVAYDIGAVQVQCELEDIPKQIVYSIK